MYTGLGTTPFLREAKVIRQRTLRVSEKPAPITGRSPAVGLAALREDETRYRELVDHLDSGVVVYEATSCGDDFVIRDFNRAAARIEQTTAQAVIGRLVTEAFPGVREFGLLAVLRRVYETGRAENHPIALYQDDHLSSWRENYVYRLPSGAVVAVYGDVTERKQAEEELSKYRLLAAEARDIMLIVRAADGAIVEANAAAEAAYGYSREELLRLHIDSLRPAAQGPGIDRRLRAAGAAGVLFETEHRRRDGSSFPVEVSSRGAAVVGGDEVSLSVVRDISEREAAERALHESEERYRVLAETSPDFIYIIDRDDCVRYVNRKGAQALGRAPEELVGVPRFDLFDSETEAHMTANLKQVFETGEALESESQWTFPRGPAWIATWLVPIKDENGWVRAAFGVSRDISTRRRAEEALRESEERYRALFERSLDCVYLHDFEGRFLDANEAALALLGYSREEINSLTFASLLDGAELSRTDAVLQELLATGQQQETYEYRLRRKDGGIVDVEIQASVVLRDGEPYAVQGIARDISRRKQAEAALVQSAAQLHRSLGGAVAALGATTEMRDPYTAGHQRRVAELACAIAVELGWGEGRIEALRTAALLHDIGKIVVPAEILSKPGRLTEVEMALIRGHAAAGAQAVAGIDFEGAVVEMIRQHHERLDGSGYPAGLRDDEILPEARILAVADVVEAMISHRPYRPALPMVEVLTEVGSGAGIRYDADVCAACIGLLQEKGFAFDS
jgi:PAS domain S-box-containing protein/putative nucleotidyltransferase with HDIG domain